MAQKVHVLLVCDLHDNEVEGSETITFALDGSSYEIDVCDTHAGQMRDAFATYVGAGRRASRSTASGRGNRRPSRGGSGRDVSAVREWARAHGHTVNERGRISSTVQQAYDAAH